MSYGPGLPSQIGYMSVSVYQAVLKGLTGNVTIDQSLKMPQLSILTVEFSLVLLSETIKLWELLSLLSSLVSVIQHLTGKPFPQILLPLQLLFQT